MADDEDAVERRASSSSPELTPEMAGRGWPPVEPEVHLANQAIGLADAALRLGLALALALLIAIVLALAVSPWFWIGVAFVIPNIVYFVVWIRRRRRTPPRELESKSVV